jgi:hypothetical protein
MGRTARTVELIDVGELKDAHNQAVRAPSPVTLVVLGLLAGRVHHVAVYALVGEDRVAGAVEEQERSQKPARRADRPSRLARSRAQEGLHGWPRRPRCCSTGWLPGRALWTSFDTSALPLRSTSISAPLGVPYTDRAFFEHCSHTIADLRAEPEAAVRAERAIAPSPRSRSCLPDEVAAELRCHPVGGYRAAERQPGNGPTAGSRTPG